MKTKEKRQRYEYVDKNGRTAHLLATRKEYLFFKLTYSRDGLTAEEFQEYKQLNN